MSMVKCGGKEVITAEIFKETYDVMKTSAEKKALEHKRSYQYCSCRGNRTR